LKKYLPIFVVVIVLLVVAYMLVQKKNQKQSLKVEPSYNIGTFTKQKSCARPPQLLQRLGIPQPVMIDLSQKKYKGIALHFGKNFEKVFHPEQWKQYEHFSTYASDEAGNIYLVPTPFISIHPTTFNLQKNIYKLESKTGKISIFMHFDDVHPTANNPYGMNAIAYDCEDKTLWVAAIDESDYASQKGVIYHINPQTKEVLQTVEGFDVLSMTIVKSQKGKYLLVGSARDNALYAYSLNKGKLSPKPEKLLEIPSANEHIRKIKVKADNHLELQTIAFSYTLIAQSVKKEREFYDLLWANEEGKWKLKKQK
jgi:hypothetical protein